LTGKQAIVQAGKQAIGQTSEQAIGQTSGLQTCKQANMDVVLA
jgi:hypothetical protein